MSGFDALVGDFIDSHRHFHPVDASFMGETDFDPLLPLADAGAAAREQAALAGFASRLAVVEVPDSAGARIDAAYIAGHCKAGQAMLAARPPQLNPAWYTGEVAFGLISLLLPGAVPRDPTSLSRRLALVPDFLADGRARLAGQAVPADWCQRARLESAALCRLLTGGLQKHPLAMTVDPALIGRALVALREFDAALDGLPDRDPAAGRELLSLLIRDVHGLDETPESLEARAAAAFDHALAGLQDAAARLDSGRDWRQLLSDLAAIGPAPDETLATYRDWNARALREATGLVTPATEYGLDFRFMPDWALDVAADLYFLFYRSPPARHAGDGSLYWVWPQMGEEAAYRRSQNLAAIKQIHAVHHGSIGHHTQNTRARAAESRIARIAGTDCASGIALLGAGTMVEGWPCYAEDLMDEVPGFYTDLERLQLLQFEMRNIACCLADVRLHSGVWSLEQMRRFYRDEVGFAPARIWSETTRNSIFPASRLMYWTGTVQIRELRARSRLSTASFHDRLLSFGSAPIAWIAREMNRETA